MPLPTRAAPAPKTPLGAFAARLRADPDVAQNIHAGIIGLKAEISGPFGPRTLVYADYVASGRALKQIENFVMEAVLPYYANSHTEASFCGGYMTRMREEAREIVLAQTGASAPTHAAIFVGSGATGALNKLVHLFGVKEAVARGENPVILVGPYEHHSNLLPWRESGANVIEIDEAPGGGVDLDHLRRVLENFAAEGPLIGAFSAASNVTGICTDVVPVTRLIKGAGGLMVWDFAGGGPYLAVDMEPAPGAAIDAVALSAHKFIGGPGASGVLVVRRDAVTAKIPGNPGGGTVAFVNSTVQDYSPRLEEREEGGTPNIIGDIRAALAMLVKDAVGQDFIARRNRDLAARAMDLFRGHPNLRLLGAGHEDRLPILSFLVQDDAGEAVDYHLFTRMLSDVFGIQARGGCACAGPYVHRLLHIDADWSGRLRRQIQAGDDSAKPGFIRLNLSYLMGDEEVDFILTSVDDLARNTGKYADRYRRDTGLAAE